tara:strand:- start:79 stop:1272 length:1194 start_codon:yes stop_codon:yes gene_type:complete
MNEKLTENNYLIVPNFISTERADALASDFKDYANKFDIKNDPQVEKCVGKYDYISFVELLCEKNVQVSQLVGETVLPTYTYARIYEKGAVLTPHVDKEECEISLTVNLECDIPWSIWIQTPKGEKKEVELNPGDAMIYFGMTAPHWREEFAGNICTQVFMHYVRSRGQYATFYFNKDRKVVTDSSKIAFNHYPDIEPANVIIDDSFNKPQKKNNLDEYIQVYDNILTEEECDKILAEYEDCSDWYQAKVGDGVEKNHVRNCEIVHISTSDIVNKNYDRRKEIDNIVFTKAGVAAQKYIEEFPMCTISTDSGYDLLRYHSGGFYTIHTDNYAKSPRTVAMSLMLSDDYEGGEFAFFNRDTILKPSKGSAVVFPANFMYPHEIMPILSGTRYSIITWFT